MKAVGRLAVVAAVCVSLVMLLCLSLVIAGYMRKPGSISGADDWVTFLLPVLPPLVTVGGWMTAWQVSSPGTLMRGFLMGIAGVSSVYIMIPAVHLGWQYGLISADGTAYWGLLAVPAFWLWLPATTMGAVGGIAVAAISSRLRASWKRGNSVDA
jgi:hypothetical protein